MIETKFKNSEVGLIPEDWEYVVIGDISTLIQTGPFGSQLHQSDYITVGTPVVMPKDLVDGRISDTSIACVSKENVERLKRHKIKDGDFLFARRGDVGRCALTSKKEVGWLCGTGCFRVSIDKKKCDINYLYYQLQRKETVEWIVSKAIGSTMLNLNTSILSQVPFVQPELLTEQSHIAKALSDIDDLIATAKKLTEKKRNIKEGVMQELLSGKRRLPGFTGKWREYKLGDVLSYEQPSKYLVSSTEYAEAGIPVLTAGKTFVLGYTFEDYGIYDNLPVIIFDDFVTESKYVDFPFKAKSSAMKMLRLRNEENILKVVFEIMQRIKFPMTEHKRYWISDYSKIKIQLPSPEEQKAILKVIDGFDDEILVLENSLTKYQSLKQGMMQQLLTGKIRLI